MVLYSDYLHSYRHLVCQKIMILVVFSMHEYRCTLHGCAKMDYTKEGEKGLIAAPEVAHKMSTRQSHNVTMMIYIYKTIVILFMFSMHEYRYTHYMAVQTWTTSKKGTRGLLPPRGCTQDAYMSIESCCNDDLHLSCEKLKVKIIASPCPANIIASRPTSCKTQK